MQLKTVHVRNYRSIRDTGVFDIESDKTILVGPNEAGKSAILQALQQIRAPKDVKGFLPLRDYPRALYNDITIGKVDAATVPVATATFELDDDDKALLPEQLRSCGYSCTRYLDNSFTHTMVNAPAIPTYGSLKKDLLRLAASIDARVPVSAGGAAPTLPSEGLNKIVSSWEDKTHLSADVGAPLKQWLDAAVPLIDEDDQKEEERLERLQEAVGTSALLNKV